jgi:hypothetical protein
VTKRERFVQEALGKLPRASKPKPKRLPIVWARTGDLVVACDDIQFDGEKEPRVKAGSIGRIKAQKDCMSFVRWRNGRRFWLSNIHLDKCLMVREGNSDDAGQGWATENASPAVKKETNDRFVQDLREMGRREKEREARREHNLIGRMAKVAGPRALAAGKFQQGDRSAETIETLKRADSLMDRIEAKMGKPKFKPAPSPRFGWNDDPEGDIEIDKKHWDKIPDDGWEN